MTPLTERNRQNAEASTGPKTEEGKTRSSQNAIAHGFYAKSALLPNEDSDEYLQYTTHYIADLKPQGPLQIDLAITVSDNFWMLRRARALVADQGKAVSTYMVNFAAEPDNDTQNILIKQTRLLDSLGRHAQRLQNATLKALKELKALQAESRKQQTQPALRQNESGFVPAPQVSAAPTPQPTTGITPESTITAPSQEQKRAA